MHFKLYGHRGARGLSPENSLPAYQTAIDIGVDFVDMDVTMTKDRVVVAQHDLSLNVDITRDQNEQWISYSKYIKEMNYSELLTYDVGRIRPGTTYSSYFPSQTPVDHTHIPTLQEVIQFVKGEVGDRIQFQIEIKNDPEHPERGYSPAELSHAVYDILKEENIIPQCQIQAFDWQCLLDLQAIDSRVATAYLTDSESEIKMRDKNPAIAGLWTAGYLVKNYKNSTAKMIKALGGTLWDPQDIEVTKDNLKEAHDLGLKVVTWSNPASGKDIDLKLTNELIEMGVDGVIVDRPDEVVKLWRMKN
ncbi:MAG: glycerophosphodiester phosphodiesterase family protein [Gammaproteobacteria bacterium]|nr:glycerophosphodiester phosphodiesterase family protein [Gammaproteobacteria bacterium]